jgi:hypothetical protein
MQWIRKKALLMHSLSMARDIGEDERGGRIARRLDPKDRRILIGWLKPTDSRC